MSEKKSYGFLMKFALLSISLLPTTTVAVSGAIPLLSRSFPEQPTAMIETLVMLPTMATALFVLLCIPISKKIGSRNTVLIGLITALIGGLGPVFANNFYLILLFRTIFGAGIGLFNSLCFTLINLFFKGEEQTKMLGYQSSFQGLGGASLTFLAGQLLLFGWHASFLCYLIIIPVLILFAGFVPKPPASPVESGKTTLCKPIVKYVLIQFLFMILYNAIVVKLPNLYESRQIANATMASNVFTITQISSMVTGFVYAYIYNFFKRNTLPFACFCLSLGFIIISLSDNLAFSILGAVLTGIVFATIVPYDFNLAALISAPSAQVLSSTLFIIGGQSAGFLCPLVLGPLGNIPILSNEFAQSFLSAGLLLAILGLALIFLQKRWRPQEK